MSKPRARWWGYVRQILFAYPLITDSSVEEDRRECAAVEAASVETAVLPDGEGRLELVQMVFFDRSHTLEGAALRLHLSYATARRRQADFVRCVGKHLGLS